MAATMCAATWTACAGLFSVELRKAAASRAAASALPSHTEGQNTLNSVIQSLAPSAKSRAMLAAPWSTVIWGTAKNTERCSAGVYGLSTAASTT